jgi:quercetin dioxygenase-like cupin family protein
MHDSSSAQSPAAPAPIPPDDASRDLALARPDTDTALPHVGMAGDTYTILLSGQDTAGRYALIDMHVPPAGGPPPHRHDFEEMFTVLDGEIEFTFRGATSIVRAGETVNVPANRPRRAHALRVLAVRPGGVLHGRRRPRRQSHAAAARTRRGRKSGVHRKGQGARPALPHGAARAVTPPAGELPDFRSPDTLRPSDGQSSDHTEPGGARLRRRHGHRLWRCTVHARRPPPPRPIHRGVSTSRRPGARPPERLHPAGSSDLPEPSPQR